jgi:DNA-binding IclR family transcriptional regulator
MAQSRYVIPAVVRATQLLECLCESRAPLGVTEISRALGINKNMVFRLLQTLQQQGWVVQSDGPKYRVGLRPFRCLCQTVQNTDVREAASTPLRELRDVTGEACYVAIVDGQRCLFVEHLESTRDVRANGRIGGSYALHCCAPGKVLLAYADERLRASVLEGELAQNTLATITSPRQLRRELDRVRQQGYAVDLEEYTRGMLCLAAPVCDAQQQVVGSLGVTALTLYYTPAEFEALLAPQVLQAARSASANLGADPMDECLWPGCGAAVQN